MIWILVLATLTLPLVLWGVIAIRQPRVKESQRRPESAPPRIAARRYRDADGELHYVIEGEPEGGGPDGADPTSEDRPTP